MELKEYTLAGYKDNFGLIKTLSAYWNYLVNFQLYRLLGQYFRVKGQFSLKG